MLLHTVNKSPFERNCVDACLSHALDGAAILFYEDAVFAAMKGTAIAGRIADAVAQKKIYVLGNDLAARGMDAAKVIDGITVVDYAGFVDLVAEAKAVQAWL